MAAGTILVLLVHLVTAQAAVLRVRLMHGIFEFNKIAFFDTRQGVAIGTGF